MANQHVETGAKPVEIDRDWVAHYLSEILALAVIFGVATVSVFASMGGA